MNLLNQQLKIKINKDTFDPSEEFRKFATKDRGISSTTLDRFQSTYANYISPTIIEERSMNVASMDVFSRLMMD